MADVSGNDVLDEGLSRLAATGPEYRGGLSNHGPMAAEALVPPRPAPARGARAPRRPQGPRARRLPQAARRPAAPGGPHHRRDLARRARQAEPRRRLGGLPPRR